MNKRGQWEGKEKQEEGEKEEGGSRRRRKRPENTGLALVLKCAPLRSEEAVVTAGKLLVFLLRLPTVGGGR